MKLLDVVHPAAKVLVQIARSQDDEVGDGTTSVVLLAGELLGQAKQFIEEGMHARVVIAGLRHALRLALAHIDALAVSVADRASPAFREILTNCAGTAMNSKLIASHKAFFSEMVVNAVLLLEENEIDANEAIGVKKEPGGAMEDSLFVDGVAFKKTFSYAGFEQQPKQFADAKVLCLNVELELKAEKDNAELRIDDPSKYQTMVDAEWKIIYDKLDACVASGANVVLSRLAIGDLATQYFADRNMFCAGRVPEGDMTRVTRATGAIVHSTCSGLAKAAAHKGWLGHCAKFEERQVGAERYNFFSGCPGSTTATIILRGGGESFIDEAARSLHDAIMIARRALTTRRIVAGGGAIELELSARLRKQALAISGKQQLVVGAFAKALEVIPRQLATNAGLDPTDIMNQLRKKHHDTSDDGKWFGVDMDRDGGVSDMYKAHVWEPALVKINALTAACEAACLIISIDETVQAERSNGGNPQ
jgi:T-complex protein 1 subunit eta